MFRLLSILLLFAAAALGCAVSPASQAAAATGAEGPQIEVVPGELSVSIQHTVLPSAAGQVWCRVCHS